MQTRAASSGAGHKGCVPAIPREGQQPVSSFPLPRAQPAVGAHTHVHSTRVYPWSTRVHRQAHHVDGQEGRSRGGRGAAPSSSERSTCQPEASVPAKVPFRADRYGDLSLPPPTSPWHRAFCSAPPFSPRGPPSVLPAVDPLLCVGQGLPLSCPLWTLSCAWCRASLCPAHCGPSPVDGAGPPSVLLPAVTLWKIDSTYQQFMGSQASRDVTVPEPQTRAGAWGHRLGPGSLTVP